MFPAPLVEPIRKYLRVEIEGLENVPRRGGAVIAPNHSSCLGFDGIVLSHVLATELRRVPKILAMWKFFELLPPLGRIARKVGLAEASIYSGLRILRRNNLLVLFPEGESGSFKPSSEAYQLREFKTGFVRMAVMTGTPIVPCLIIGAEESNINLGTLRLGRWARGLQLPIPLNLIPLPAKWKIRFLPPISLREYRWEDALDAGKMTALAARIREQVQAELLTEIQRRPYVFFPEAAA